MSGPRLVRSVQEIRADAVLDKNTIEHWNRTHPDEEPLDGAFWDAVIAWCDGRGPFPASTPATHVDAVREGPPEGGAGE